MTLDLKGVKMRVRMESRAILHSSAMGQYRTVAM